MYVEAHIIAVILKQLVKTFTVIYGFIYGPERNDSSIFASWTIGPRQRDAINTNQSVFGTRS